jgi:membrane carboxypeptidase/penicillin-binding protein
MHGIAEVAVCPRIWKAFMEEALKTEPIASFPEPKGLVKATICLDSGLLAGQFCPPERVMIGTYWKDRVPNHSCDIHTAPIEDHVVPDNEIEQYPLPKYNGE